MPRARNRPPGRPGEIPEREFRDLERLLGQLDDHAIEMADEDIEFIDGLCARVIERGRSVVVTEDEWRGLRRLKREHLP